VQLAEVPSLHVAEQFEIFSPALIDFISVRDSFFMILIKVNLKFGKFNCLDDNKI